MRISQRCRNLILRGFLPLFIIVTTNGPEGFRRGRRPNSLYHSSTINPMRETGTTVQDSRTLWRRVANDEQFVVQVHAPATKQPLLACGMCRFVSPLVCSLRPSRRPDRVRGSSIWVFRTSIHNLWRGHIRFKSPVPGCLYYFGLFAFDEKLFEGKLWYVNYQMCAARLETVEEGMLSLANYV